MSPKPSAGNHTRKWIGAGVLLALAVAAAVAGSRYGSEASKGASHLAASPGIPVQVASAVRADVPVYLSGIGTVQAFNTVTVRAQVDGQLQQVLFSEGQQVKKGDLLAVIDPRPFQAALDQATAKIQQDKANLDNARIILARFQKLASQSFETQAALDTQTSTVAQLVAQIAQDEAAKEAAATQLSFTQLRAPLDGRTGIRLVDQGNIVHATDSTGLVVITQTQPISVISTLAQEALPVLRAAQKMGPVSVTAFTNNGATNLGSGTLLLIDNEIDQSNGTLRLKSTFPNKDELLWPGQFVEIRLQQQIAKNALTVPSSAVQRGPQGFYVYVVTPDNLVETRSVKIGQIASGQAIVDSGVSEGERVVTSGPYRLEPGVKVAIDVASSPSAAKTGP